VPGESIDPRVDIGDVHLKVADIGRALAFYHGVLGDPTREDACP
jgi:catechol-2,3-dioxygenase